MAGRRHSASALAAGCHLEPFEVAIAEGDEAITKPVMVSPNVTNPDTSRIYRVVTRFRLILGTADVTGAWQAVDGAG